MPRSLVELAIAGGMRPKSAARFEVFACPACANAHVVLFDHNDEPFAQMTVDPHGLDVLDLACADVFDHNNGLESHDVTGRKNPP